MERLLIFIFLFLSSICYSQRIYRAENKDSAKYIIYESFFKSDTTYSVYIVKDTTEFIGQGNWYFVTDESKADFVLYFTNNKNEADFRVYYVNSLSELRESKVITKKTK